MVDVTSSDFLKALKSLSYSGSEHLDEAHLKVVKQFCRKSDANVRYCAHLLLMHLSKMHSEIRYSTFQIVHELFQRSYLFRELILEDFAKVLKCTLETEGKLPPPAKAAQALKGLAARCIKQWHEKFGKSYSSLHLGFNFLKNCNKVNFDAVDAHDLTNVVPINRCSSDNIRETSMSKRHEKLLNSFEEISNEISSSLSQIFNCMRILFPSFDELVPDTFVHDESEKTLDSEDRIETRKDVSDDDSDDDNGFIEVPDKPLTSFREHGMNDVTYSITVDVSPPDETTNKALLDLYVELRFVYLIRLKKLMNNAMKLNSQGSLLKRMLEVKANALAGIAKCEEVLPAEDLRMVQMKHSDASTAHVGTFVHSKSDPSLLDKQQKRNYNEPPVIPFGNDIDILFHPEEAARPCFAPSAVESTPWCSESNRDVEMPNELVNYLMVRTKEYVPDLPPITRSCRAPLGNGRLCTRMDRVKCPFHGVIIDRDENGVPKCTAILRQIPTKGSSTENVDRPWEDEDLINDINAATNANIPVRKKKKVSKKKKMKSGNLTDLKKLSTNTPKKRLAKILSKASTIRRITTRMDEIQKRQNFARFYQQFNYAFEK